MVAIIESVWPYKLQIWPLSKNENLYFLLSGKRSLFSFTNQVGMSTYCNQIKKMCSSKSTWREQRFLMLVVVFSSSKTLSVVLPMKQQRSDSVFQTSSVRSSFEAYESPKQPPKKQLSTAYYIYYTGCYLTQYHRIKGDFLDQFQLEKLIYTKYLPKTSGFQDTWCQFRF